MLGVYDYTVVLTYISLMISIGGMMFAVNGHLHLGVMCLARMISKLLSSNGVIIDEISVQGENLETYFENLIGGTKKCLIK